MEQLRDLSKVTATINPVTGPVHVEGAEPGDALAVTIHDIEMAEQGWSVYIPGAGALGGPMGEDWFVRRIPIRDGRVQPHRRPDLPGRPHDRLHRRGTCRRRDVDGHAVLPHRRQHGPDRRHARVDGVPARPGGGGAAVDRRHPRRHEPRRVLVRGHRGRRERHGQRGPRQGPVACAPRASTPATTSSASASATRCRTRSSWPTSSSSRSSSTSTASPGRTPT